MPLPFALVCDLLDECYRLCLAGRPNSQAVVNWFARHRGRIDAHDTSLAALLSTLLPEKRTDRVYCIQVASLEKIVGRALILGSSRIAELATYKQPGLGLDLADCIERILTPNPLPNDRLRPTVEEIDDSLHGLASKIRWSSPAIRNSQSMSLTPRNRGDLEGIYRRLGAREAKWFTRLILKDFQTLIFEPNIVYRWCHPVLPSILKIQDDFAAAIKVIEDAKGKMLLSSIHTAPMAGRVLASVKPQIGINVGRQNWLKARSVKHCLNMGHGRMSIENKIDGEYCQIHVDATSHPRIQIFSKSGKDSTEDRQAILKSLRLGLSGSKIRTRCILEGELVVYDDLENKILPFHRIRNHVARRGLFLNTEDDTPSSTLVGHVLAGSELRKAFAKIIVEKDEGLVLKPDQQYFNFHQSDQPFSGCCIKLKKDYIGSFGDVGDFTIVGAGFNAATARSFKIPNLQWTHFYLGCLENREQVKRWNVTPELTVVSVVELNVAQLKTVVAFGNPMPVPLADNDATRLKIPKGLQTGTPLTVAFRNPIVVDMRYFNFDKPGNMGFWTLRFPLVSKIHFDRDYSDTVTFEELQNMAKDATTAPEFEDSQENLAWIARLENADPRGCPVDASSQMTATTMPTPSPVNPTQTTTGCDLCLSPLAARWAGQVYPERPGVPKQRTRRSAMPPGVVAPPSSLLQENKLEKPQSAQKRSAASFSTPSPSHKRRRATGRGPASSSPVQNGLRRALVDVDCNASQNSQNSATSHASLAIESPKMDKPGGGHRPAPPQEVGDTDAAHSKNDDLDWTRRDFGQSRAKVPLGEDTETPQENMPCSGPSYLAGISGSVADSTNGIKTSCSYAGAECYFSGSTVLLSSASLTDSLEPAALLKTHGIFEAATPVEQWWNLEGQAWDSRPSPKQDQATIRGGTI